MQPTAEVFAGTIPDGAPWIKARTHRPSLRDRVRQSRTYTAAAEVSYIARWMALKAASLAVKTVPVSRERRADWTIRLGNKLFHPSFPREVYTNFESYVSLMDASLNLYERLYPKERWLCGREVLVIGSGLGQYTNSLVQRGAFSVTGLEYQPSKADWASARFPSPRIRFVTGSAEAMPFDAGSFDTAFSHTVFEHLGDVAAALAEVRRVLRPQGVALISYNFFHHRGGHHLFPYIHFPWATWIAEERTLCDYWSQRLAVDQAKGMMKFYDAGARIQSLSEGAEIRLNKLNFEEFESLVAAAGLHVVRRMPSEQLARMFPWLTRLPRLRYFLAGTIYYVLSPDPKCR